MAAGRYKEARDAFVKAAADHPSDYEALHGAGVACLYLHEDAEAARLLEKAAALAPAPDRALSYNYAVADVNRHDYRRAAQTLRDYLYANPNTPDEPLLDALGAALFQTGSNNTASRASDDVRKFFAVYTAAIEAQRPGFKRWGTKWLTAAEVDARVKRMQQAEVDLSLAAKELAAGKGRLEDYRQELQAARQGRGVRSAKDAARMANDEERKLKDLQAKYDAAAARIDTVRPEYPQLLLPMAVDQRTPPPFEAAAVAPSPASPVAPSTPAGPTTPPTAIPSAPAASVSASDASPTAPAVPAPPQQPAAPPKPPAAATTADTPGVRGPTVTEGIGDDQVRQCRVDADGTLTVDREVRLLFHGTERRDFMITGEAFLGGGGDNGGVVFYLRERDGTHRYELTGGGLRAKRLMLEGRPVAQFANPFKLDAARDRWVPFHITANADAIDVSFDGQTGTAKGPLSMDGTNSVVLQPGAKLRNVQVVKTSDQAAAQGGRGY